MRNVKLYIREERISVNPVFIGEAGLLSMVVQHSPYFAMNTLIPDAFTDKIAQLQ